MMDIVFYEDFDTALVTSSLVLRRDDAMSRTPSENAMALRGPTHRLTVVP